MPDQNKYAITVKEFAKSIDVCLATAYAMTEIPGFPLLRVGKKKLVLLRPLEDWLQQQAKAQ